MRLVHRTQTPSDALLVDILPTRDDLERARTLTDRLAGAGLRKVKLFEAPSSLSKGKNRTWIAAESMQVTGSFKVRGALLAIERLKTKSEAEEGKPLVILAVSAGNHGIGVAHAAKHFGVEAHVVVPRGAPKNKIEKIERAGAHVIIAKSSGYDGAEQEALALAKARGATFLSPYDDVDVLTGNGASLGFEIVAALRHAPRTVYCPIGGGGLATGLASAFRHDGHGTIVIPVQSEASCAFAMSLERDAAVVELPPADTIAEGLEGGISERAFARARALIDRAIVVTEQEIAHAMRFAARELGMIIEGSAAVALAPELAHLPVDGDGEDGDTVIVLTGRNVDPERLAHVLST